MCPWGVVNLGQNPSVHPQHTGQKPRLITILKAPQLLFSTKHGRWLTGKELLAVHSYPVYPQLSFFGAECSFNRRREDRRWTVMKRDATRCNHISR